MVVAATNLLLRRGKWLVLMALSLTVLFTLFCMNRWLLTRGEIRRLPPQVINKHMAQSYEHLTTQMYANYSGEPLDVQCQALQDDLWLSAANGPLSTNQAFSKLFWQYVRFHRDAMRHVDLQNLEQLPADLQLLVYETDAASGIGNLNVGVASSLVLAMLTKRVLIVKHKVGSAHLHCLTDTGVFNWFHTDIQQITADSVVRWTDLNGVPPASVRQVSVWWQALSDEMWQSLFMDDQRHRDVAAIPILQITSWLYYLPGMYQLPTFGPILRELFVDGLPYRQMYGHLFAPSDTVWRQVKLAIKEVGYGDNYILGAQLRHFVDFDSTQYGDKLRQCQAEAPSYFSLPSDAPKNVTLMIMSLVDDAAKQLADVVRATNPGMNIRVYQHSVDGKQMYNDANQTIAAWVESMTLGIVSNRLIVSAMSTLGYQAIALHVKRPFFMRSDRDGYPTERHVCMQAPTHFDACSHESRHGLYGSDRASVLEQWQLAPCTDFEFDGLMIQPLV